MAMNHNNNKSIPFEFSQRIRDVEIRL